MTLPELSESARKTLAALLAMGPSSRPQLSAATELSKQTISIAVEELVAEELVEPTSVHQGPTGRAASVYDLGRRSGWLLGVDFGSTHIRLAATSLGGEVLHEEDVAVSQPVNTANADFTEDARMAIAGFIERVSEEGRRLLAACVALSRAVPTLRDWNRVQPGEMFPGDLQRILGGLGIPEEAAFFAENNVNCAALGELRRGAGQEEPDFAYLQVGVGIGAGIVSDARLVRGSRGQAGELRYLPSPLHPGEYVSAENALDAAGMIERFDAVRGAGEPPARSVEDIVARAADGSPTAVEVLDRQADGVALLVAALVAVANPTKVILGGGIGQAPAIAERVAERISRMGLSVLLEPGVLRDSATVAGAVSLAREMALDGLVGPGLGFEIARRHREWSPAPEVAHPSVVSDKDPSLV
ncbi:ROK family protein [Leifsonia sp. 2TAF2]|uniref:ROK family protein n=1 Tax=Leifsonia sp. 2TAF2 TaxID=3233009 RepID=UPI003F998B1C